jgi:hypothetical protein
MKLVAPTAVQIRTVVVPQEPAKAASRPEVQAVVAEVSRALNAWLYS